MKDRFENRKILNNMSGAQMRGIMTRSLARLDIDLPGIRFRVASSVDDYEGAIRLVNACYVRRGILNPDHVHIPALMFSPRTIVLVAVDGDEVIGTVSIIGETKFGFPMEAIHGQEVAGLRSVGQGIVEIGGLSVLEKYRNTGVFLILSSMLYRYVRYFSGVNTAIMASHPSTECFYSGVFLFDKFGPVQRYEQFAGARSVPFKLDLAEKSDDMRVHYGKIALHSKSYETLYDLYCSDEGSGLFDYSSLLEHHVLRSERAALSPGQIRDLYARFSLKLDALSSQSRDVLERFNPGLMN